MRRVPRPCASRQCTTDQLARTKRARLEVLSADGETRDASLKGSASCCVQTDAMRGARKLVKVGDLIEAGRNIAAGGQTPKCQRSLRQLLPET